MDASELATLAVSTLSPYLVKGGEEIATSAAKGLWDYTKGLFTTDKEKKTFTDFEEMPDNQISQGKLIGKLEDKLEGNQEVFDRLKQLIENTPSQKKINSQTVIGNNNNSAQDISGSTISFGNSKGSK